MKNSTQITLLYLIVLCIFAFILSLIIGYKIIPEMIYDQVNENVALSKGSEPYDRFIELPFPVDFKVYIFHVENPDDIMKKGAKPKLTQKGPYVYKQYRKKTIISINENDDTITYRQNEFFEFDAVASGSLRENDTVTVINAPMLISFQAAEDILPAGLGILSSCIHHAYPVHNTLFINISIREMLFDGMELCPQKKKGPIWCQMANDQACSIAETKKFVHKATNQSLMFAFFNYKNFTDDGIYTINRGIKNITKLGHIKTWNNLKYTDFWGENTTCSEVKGTDSTLYPPRVTKDEIFYIFATDICRYVPIHFQKEDTYKGIDGYLFGTDSTTLRPSTYSPQEDCYCRNLTRDINGVKSCFLDGVIDMQSCTKVPIVLSFPHFLEADEKYLNGVEGLHPDPDIHKTFLLVEPNTGIPLQGVKRIQINSIIRPISSVSQTKKLPRAMLPLVWIEEGVKLTDKYIDELNTLYFNKILLADCAKWGSMCMSLILLFVFSGTLTYKRIRQSRKTF